MGSRPDCTDNSDKWHIELDADQPIGASGPGRDNKIIMRPIELIVPVINILMIDLNFFFRCCLSHMKHRRISRQNLWGHWNILSRTTGFVWRNRCSASGGETWTCFRPFSSVPFLVIQNQISSAGKSFSGKGGGWRRFPGEKPRRPHRSIRKRGIR